MTDHLPECPREIWTANPWNKINEITDLPCICGALRACEQRVLNDLVPNLHLADMQGYNRGLRAAEAAVAAIPVPRYCDEDWGSAIAEALSAIAALKEKP